MLEVRDLHASAGGKEILKGVSLSVPAGEVHALMGPNASGKSTLAHILVGHPGYRATSGEVLFEGRDLLALPPEERARAGILLCFQNPVEIPGVRLDQFMRAGYNALRKSRGQEPLDALKFDRLISPKVKLMEMDPNLLKRSVNEGFSGGEKKRNEILQMAVLEPRLCILDEPDSGLDVDAMQTVAGAINKLRNPQASTLLITHYSRILASVVPDAVHVLIDGRIVKSGTRELALEIEAKGYDWLEQGLARA
jgi:Fe-S cluster assembly ATP-binding protein